MSLHSLARAKDTSTAPKTFKASNAPETPQKSYTHPRAARRAQNTSTAPNTSKKPNPHYSACQDTDLSKLETAGTAEPIDDSAKTEAEFCFSCEWAKWKDQARDLVGLKTVEKPKELPHAKEFKERLRKRAIGQVMTKIYQSESTRACLISDEDWFLKKGTKMNKDLCKARTKELKQAVKDSWPEMRINMALRDAKLGGSASYGVQQLKMMDDTPSHTALPDTVDIPPLTEEEKQIARDRHIEALSTLKLDKLSPEDLAKQLRSKKKLGSTKRHVTGINQRDLTNKDIDKIKAEQRRLRDKSEADYLTMIAKMPFLAYLKDGEGKTRDIDQAFSTLSKYLTDFLKKLEDPEVDMAVLLSFNSLAEGLLAEDSKYCLAAEGATIDAKEDESFDDYALMGLGLASMVPCFIAGPVTLSACVAGGTAVGVAGYAEAKAAQRSALDSVLSGANLEKLSEWRANGQNAKIEAMLLPLAVIGAPVSAGLRVAKEGIKAVVSATGRGARGATAMREARAKREIIYPENYKPKYSTPIEVLSPPRPPKIPLPMSGDEATDQFRKLYNNGAYEERGAYKGLFLGHAEESRYISVEYNGEVRPAIIGDLSIYTDHLKARVKVGDEWRQVHLNPERLKTARLNPALHQEVLANQSRPHRLQELPMTGNYIKLDYFGMRYYGRVERVSQNPRTGQPEVTIDFVDNNLIFDVPNANRSYDLQLGPRVIDNQNLPFIETIDHDAFYKYKRELQLDRIDEAIHDSEVQSYLKRSRVKYERQRRQAQKEWEEHRQQIKQEQKEWERQRKHDQDRRRSF